MRGLARRGGNEEVRMNRSTALGMGVLLVSGCADMGVDSTDPRIESVVGQTAALTAGKPRPGAGEGAHRFRCPADVPAALDPPPGSTIEAAFDAQGVQIYVCAVPAAGGAPAWTLKAPHAILLTRGGDVAGIHFAGPSWQANDGSIVTGTRVASAAAPDATAIPW